MSFRFEFDAVNKVLLVRADGQLTDDLLAEGCEKLSKCSADLHARASIVDFAAVSDFSVSTEFVRRLAKQEPAMPEAVIPRVLVAPQIHVYGVVRMFQIMGEDTRPLLRVTRTLEDALASLGVPSAHFEPLT